jgi:hypothetical protein
MIQTQSTRKADLWLSIFLVAVVILLSGVVYATGDLTTYMATPLAIANDGIFTNDFSIMEFMRPNAQSVSDNVMALFLRLGISWQALSVIGYIVTVAVFAAGIIAIAKRISGERYYITAALLMLFSIYAMSGLRIGRNPIWYPSFYYAQAAFCIAVWGFVKALDKKWYAAFILFAIASLLHFTAGSYSAAYALVFLVIQAVREKKYKLLLAPLIWIAACIGVFLLMYLSGSTGSGLLSNEQFVKIHAYLRHPHHHVPSSWERLEWINYIAYIAGVFLVYYYAAKDSALYKKIKPFLLISTALMALILIANYLFVEVVPIAFVAKLQPARCVFVYRFFLAVVLALGVYHLVAKKEYFAAALVVFMTVLPQIDIKTYSGILLLLSAAYMIAARYFAKKNIVSVKVILHMAAIMLVILTITLFAANIALMIKILYSLAFMILIAVTYMADTLVLKKGEAVFIKAAAAVLAVVIILIPWVDIRGNFESVGVKSPESVFTLSDIDGSAKVLAQRFNENTDRRALFVGDPNDITTAYFRIFSLRSSVVAFKNMPFTDNGMREWVERLMALGAVYVDDNGYYARNTTSFDELTPAEIMAVASEYGAGYILVDFNEDKVAEFEALGAEVFDSQGRWTVLEVEQ